jgi:hypothetical protein
MKSVCHTVQHHIKLPEASWVALNFSRPISMFLDLIFPPVRIDLYFILVLWFTLKIYPCRIVCNRMKQNFFCNGTQCDLILHLLSHTNKCTNYIIYYLKSVLITDIKTLSYFHSSSMFRHITCHPQGALMFLAKITGKAICKKWTYIVWRVWQHIMNSRVHACSVCYCAFRHSSTHCNSWYAATPFTQYMFMFYKLFYQWF